MKRKNKNEKVLKSVRPNLGLEVEYRAKLRSWIDLMHNSVMYWIKASYNQNEPILAQDAVPATQLQKALRKLTTRWRKNFNEASPLLARWFAKKVYQRSDRVMEKILKDAGFTVEFKMTPAQRDILHATVHANVSLIRSIPTQYLTQVEGIVMRSVQTGRDLGTLTKELQSQYRISHKRAALIARDQNSKATSALNHARQQELGIRKAIWLHSHAGKTPRPKHLAYHMKEYDIKKGAKVGDKGQYTWPGFEINCRCTSRPVIEGFS